MTAKQAAECAANLALWSGAAICLSLTLGWAGLGIMLLAAWWPKRVS